MKIKFNETKTEYPKVDIGFITLKYRPRLPVSLGSPKQISTNLETSNSVAEISSTSFFFAPELDRHGSFLSATVVLYRLHSFSHSFNNSRKSSADSFRTYTMKEYIISAVNGYNQISLW